MAGATDQIRASLQRVAERLRKRATDAKISGYQDIASALLIVADELAAEAVGKKLKP